MEVYSITYKYLTDDSLGRRTRERYVQSREHDLSVPLIFGTHDSAKQHIVENYQAEQIDDNVFEREDVRYTIVAVPVL